MLECGRLSASGNNEQPWKFGVITDAYTIKRIADAASVNFSQAWIETSPLLIILCTQLFDSINEKIALNRFPSLKEKIKDMDYRLYSAVNMEEHQTKIPGEHMVLAALEHGVYSTWISSVDCELVGKIIEAQSYIVTNVIAFGYPEYNGKLTIKKDLSSITFTNHFDNSGYRI
jgi:nitroreductase